MQYEDFEFALDEFATFKRSLEDAYADSADPAGLFELLEAKKRELWQAHTAGSAPITACQNLPAGLRVDDITASRIAMLYFWPG